MSTAFAYISIFTPGPLQWSFHVAQSYVRKAQLFVMIAASNYPAPEPSMLKALPSTKPRLANAPQLWQYLHAHAGRGWRAWVAVITAITFVLLVSTAATHRHATSLEDQGCSLCAAVVHKLTGSEPALKLAQTVVFLAYRLPSVQAIDIDYPAPLLFPPSCGPPALC